jgi:multidrug efflux system membrane fusion protein
MMGRWAYGVGRLLWVGLAAAACQRGEHASVGTPGDGNRPVPVRVAEVRLQDVPIHLLGIGNVVAFNSVLVRPQVDGRLDRIDFVEGQDVKQGERLAQLDLRPFEIVRAQAAAALARDQATLVNAQVNLQRNKTLREKNFIGQQALTDQQALVDQTAATVLADKAALNSALLQIDYANIRAPLAGRTGVRRIDRGNIVHASDPDGLVLLTQLDPIAVLFSLPEDQLPKVVAAMRAAAAGVAVEALGRDGQTVLGTGRLLLVDNQINSATATLQLKAIFPNPEQTLWPNQFIKVRLRLEVRPQVATLPTAAVQYGPDGPFAYLLNPSDHVEARPLQLGETADDRVIALAGLQAGDRVVLEGQAQLRPGSLVAPSLAPAHHPAHPGAP